MQVIYDFLSFKSVISPSVLIIFYFLGAIVLPFATWFFTIWLRKKFFLVDTLAEEVLKNQIVQKHSFRFKIMFLLMFVFMEIMWRIMFEFLISYFQMREALLSLTSLA